MTEFRWGFDAKEVTRPSLVWLIAVLPLPIFLSYWTWNSEKIVAYLMVVFTICMFCFCIAASLIRGRYSIQIIEGFISAESPNSLLGDSFKIACSELESLDIQRWSGGDSGMAVHQEYCLLLKSGQKYTLSSKSDIPLAEILAAIRNFNSAFECRFFSEGVNRSDLLFEYFPELNTGESRRHKTSALGSGSLGRD